MNIEENIFSKMKINYTKLVNYGFVKKDKLYKFSKRLMDNNFNAEITITEDGEILGKIYDLEFGDEYINFRREDNIGEFVGTVRDEYKKILIDIANNCCERQYYTSNQANRITERVIKKYNTIPEFLWDDTPASGIFRNQSSGKWYGIIMNINIGKISDGNYNVDILNVKLDKNKIVNLLECDGFYPAYHMNKKSWITIILNDSLKDDEIMNYIEESYNCTNKP